MSMCVQIDEAAARRLLAIFAQRKARAGEILKHGEVFTIFAEGDVQLDHFKAGADFAVKRGWVKKTEQDHYMLTPEGFSAYH
jgi:hypothetical protein